MKLQLAFLAVNGYLYFHSLLIESLIQEPSFECG